MLRTHTCGQLSEQQVGETVTLCGWVDSYRDHGGGLFVDLRDRYGITQVVFNPPDSSAAVIEASKALRAEYVIRVTGHVAPRPEGMANPQARDRSHRTAGHRLSNCSTNASPLRFRPVRIEATRRRPAVEASLS